MTTSHDLFMRAQRCIPGGVNSPVRAFKSVGGEPPFIARGSGPHVFDVEGRRYIDYVGSWGPLILGHADPLVIAAVQAAAEQGLGFGAPTENEVLMAETICRLMPSIEMVRLVSSGTEATLSALRLARAATGRDTILKFEGCYHGHSDSLLVKAGSGALTYGVPSSPGIPADIAQHTLTATFNNLDEVTAIFQQQGERIAAIIVEPVAGNMNMILPQAGFLQGLRKLCDDYGSLLIFDEVMTGFRVGLGGAQALYSVVPDLTTLGKIIGGGLPVGAFGGKRALMEQMAPLGPVYQAGTLSGNPVAVAAGLATLNRLTQPGFYDVLSKRTQQLTTQLGDAAHAAGVPFTAVALGGMFGLYFTDCAEITRYEQALACNVAQFRRFFHSMLAEGIYLAPSPFEAGFVSIAHDDVAIQETVAAAARAFAHLR